MDGDTGDSGEPDASKMDASGAGSPDRREIVVPLRLYKTVTIFSTLIAIVCVLAGFMLLDTATANTQATVSEVNVALAVLGLATIAAGAIVYVFSTRFRAEGMGNAKDESDERSDNG